MGLDGVELLAYVDSVCADLAVYVTKRREREGPNTATAVAQTLHTTHTPFFLRLSHTHTHTRVHHHIGQTDAAS